MAASAEPQPCKRGEDNREPPHWGDQKVATAAQWRGQFLLNRDIAVQRFPDIVLVLILDSSVFLLFLMTVLKPTQQLQQQ